MTWRAVFGRPYDTERNIRGLEATLSRPHDVAIDEMTDRPHDVANESAQRLAGGGNETTHSTDVVCQRTGPAHTCEHSPCM